MNNGFIVVDSMKNCRSYDGTTRKFGITVANENYIVKYKKDTISSLYSEHIASRFIQSLCISCHETWLGKYNNEPVVIIKDFTTKNEKFRSFKSTCQSSEDTDLSTKMYTYDDVLDLINKHTKMSDINKQKMVEHFCNMFVCDAILGNRDRNPGNWGYIKCKNNTYRPAPIYDNGGSLFPDIEHRINNYIAYVNNNKEFIFIDERAEKFPASLFQMKRDNGEIKRTNYYEMLSDLRINKTLAKSVRTIKEKVGFNIVYENIFRIVSSLKNFIPKSYRRFYVIIVCVRYLHIIERQPVKSAYKKTIMKLDSDSRTL